MKFFISSYFAAIIGLLSLFSSIGLVYTGHVAGMQADVAISCFVGLISMILAALFMSFVALAQEIVRLNKREF